MARQTQAQNIEDHNEQQAQANFKATLASLDISKGAGWERNCLLSLLSMARAWNSIALANERSK